MLKLYTLKLKKKKIPHPHPLPFQLWGPQLYVYLSTLLDNRLNLITPFSMLYYKIFVCHPRWELFSGVALCFVRCINSFRFWRPTQFSFFWVFIYFIFEISVKIRIQLFFNFIWFPSLCAQYDWLFLDSPEVLFDIYEYTTISPLPF